MKPKISVNFKYELSRPEKLINVVRKNATLLVAFSLIGGIGMMASPAEAMSPEQCITKRGDKLVNRCNADLMVWYRQCRGAVGLTYIDAGEAEFNGSTRCGPQILKVCVYEDNINGTCSNYRE